MRSTADELHCFVQFPLITISMYVAVVTERLACPPAFLLLEKQASIGWEGRLEKPFATAVDLNGQKIKCQRADLFPALDRTFCCQDLNRPKVWTNRPTNLPHSPLGFELTPLLTADPLLELETFLPIAVICSRWPPIKRKSLFNGVPRTLLAVSFQKTLP
ncbi:hypothetical protein TNIN_98101 [Trichonephila inaurata madagascariensis]|uniref:Uncharacterized protein n=1 Tax=Trichonephila inaurata madagascariensis TaxID=2747483 RepID=A0A8X6XP62_9ARAC|nr:hypothetical protein TNIN_98101 [Trichonephila inaurata madagascariensis]